MKKTHSRACSLPCLLLVSACAASLATACGSDSKGGGNADAGGTSGSGGSSSTGGHSGSGGSAAGGKSSKGGAATGGSGGDSVDDAGGASASGGTDSAGGALSAGGGGGESGGSSGSSGDDGGARSAGSAGAGGVDSNPAVGKPGCLARGNQIVAVGDSYMDFMGSVTTLARTAGTLAGDDSFRSFAVGGAPMQRIQAQFETARSQDAEIVAAAINGGANDFVRVGFTPGSIDAAAHALAELLVEMGSVGVRDAFYVWYPNVGWGASAGMASAFVKMAAACQAAVSLRCHLIDLRPIFAGKEAQYEAGLYLAQPGKDAAGQALFDAMNASCVGQPDSATCCEP
jgi:hypothetical protein